MEKILKTMINAMESLGSGFASCNVGKYTIMLTDDDEGAEYLKDACDKYIGEEEETSDGE